MTARARRHTPIRSPRSARCHGAVPWVLAFAQACLPAAAHAQSRLDGKIALSSQLVDRGLAITPATPILQGAVSWASPAGWSLGVAAAVETRSPGTPVMT